MPTPEQIAAAKALLAKWNIKETVNNDVKPKAKKSAEQTTNTVVTGAAAQAQQKYYNANKEVFDGVLWVSVLDTKTSPICQNYDGRKFPLDSGPRPPVHINCRSQITPIVKDWEAMGLSDLGEGTREAMDGEVPEGLTYFEWLKRQPPHIQDEVLGPARGKLFRAGKLNLDRYVDDTGRRLTLEELAGRERKHLKGLPKASDPTDYDWSGQGYPTSITTPFRIAAKKAHADRADFIPLRGAGDLNRSLGQYSGFTFQPVNALLRGKNKVRGDLITGSYLAIAQKVIKDMKEGFRDLARPKTVYRGMNGNKFKQSLNWKVGQRITNQGFMSTSAIAEKPLGFAGSGTRGVMMEIKLPAGTRTIVTNDDELEVILDSGSQVVVTKRIDVDPDSKLGKDNVKVIYHMTLVNDGTKEI